MGNSQAYRIANKEKIKQARHAWYEANKATANATRNSSRELKDKAAIKSKEWYKANRERARLAKESLRIQKTYGITKDEYDRLKRQATHCPICGMQFTKTGWSRQVLDHCHLTGKLRGFICNKCNVAIGGLNDDPILVRKALEWIEGSPK